MQSTTTSPSNEIKNTTMAIKPVSPENRTLPGKIEEKPDKVADDKSVTDDKSVADNKSVGHFSRLVVYRKYCPYFYFLGQYVTTWPF